MKLPSNLLSNSYCQPDLLLCETDKSKICRLEPISLNGVFKFNSYSELTFSISRTYTDTCTGLTKPNPYYDKIEGLRLVDLNGFGFFQIQDPEIHSDGQKEIKTIKAYSLEYMLSKKYINNFKINTGEIDSLEVIYANNNKIQPITLYNQNKNLSLLDLALTKMYGWSVGYVDENLKNEQRTFDIASSDVYDFLVNDVCEKFNCFIIFDTYKNTINVYSEALISKFFGNGTNDSFIIDPPYSDVSQVLVNGYRTINYTYDNITGTLVFTEVPKNGDLIEVVDGSQNQWMTDVFISFDNLAKEINISYNTDDIKTVLNVEGQDNLDIREVNMGLPYLLDLSYYYNIDWMGQQLYESCGKYFQKLENNKQIYKDNFKKMRELNNYISYNKNRLALQYVIANNVNSTTVGKYYIRGGSYPDYYYIQVELPKQFNASVEHYYTLSGSNINEDKFYRFYSAMRTYYNSKENKDTKEFISIKKDFEFMETQTIDNLINLLSQANTLQEKDSIFYNFLDILWDELGYNPLNRLYKEQYEYIKKTNEDAGWNDPNNENYLLYYPVTIVCSSINKDIEDRLGLINDYQKQYDNLYQINSQISTDNSLQNNFTNSELIRLDSFLREDLYSNDNFLVTKSDSTEMQIKMREQLLESGRIELHKISSPKLQFSMNLANIYALKEFEPMIKQFQLGNFIMVSLRENYVKRSRIMEVEIDFNDFASFTCKFGELTSLRTPSSIHADLLANAMKAGGSLGIDYTDSWEKPVYSMESNTSSKFDIDSKINLHNEDKNAHKYLKIDYETQLQNHNTNTLSHENLFTDDNKNLNNVIINNINKHNISETAHQNLINNLNINLSNHNNDVNSHPNLKVNILESVYPVGAIYLSTVKVSPAELFGGEWTRIKNRFLFACDGNGKYYNGLEGGEENHKLTIAEIPPHKHKFNNELAWSQIDAYGSKFRTGDDSNTVGQNILNTVSVGGGQAHNNMPPYLAVYMWQRIK